MQKKITINLMAIALITIILVLALGLGLLYAAQVKNAENRLRSEADFLSTSLAQAEDPAAYLRLVDPNPAYGGWITYITPDGEILYDTYMDQLAQLPNVRTRPEVQEALEQGVGGSTRYSTVHQVPTIFRAVRMPNGYVLRLATPLSSIFREFANFLPAALITACIVQVLSTLVARRMTRQVVAPINAIDLDNPLEVEIYDELTPLLTRIDQQNQQIQETMLQLQDQQRKFTAVVDHMQEGMMLLDAEQHVLSINKSARRFFHASEAAVGNPVLEAHDTPAMRTLMTRATSGKYCDAIDSIPQEDVEYFIMCNPVWREEILRGFVLIVLDITYARETERMRREFSSNVSHELKTPLTSIAGYAEIMVNGIAKEEDMRPFARRIHDECMRLRDMIDGVMLLSKLDESGDALPFEELDLYALAQSQVAQLRPLAEENSVQLTLRGAPTTLRAIPGLIEEMVHNLIENAIRYNRVGGKVDVQVRDRTDQVILVVSDTGIGISREAQGRVFERFYRAEKSRAKHLGGTGLGLAIVKHSARLHGAEIILDSVEGIGTVFHVIFDKLPADVSKGRL